MVKPEQRIREALAVLTAIEVPKEQRNERSALTLLGLLGITPSTAWKDASAPLRGITQLMAFFTEHYQKEYAPNSRETVRRFTMHQFIEAGIAASNPDKPTRPINSPKWCYQVTDSALRMARSFETSLWRAEVEQFRAVAGSLVERNAARRDMLRVPVVTTDGTTIQLTPGGQNDLIKAIIEEFCPRFAPGGRVVYVGDAGQKWAYFDLELLAGLGVVVDSHGKMPDVVVFQPEKGWLLLIEAVTSHGPVNPKRVRELRALFDGVGAALVFVTAFEDRSAFARYAADVSWETEVWVADAPTHMIHFNGDRYLGPH